MVLPGRKEEENHDTSHLLYIYVYLLYASYANEHTQIGPIIDYPLLFWKIKSWFSKFILVKRYPTPFFEKNPRPLSCVMIGHFFCVSAWKWKRSAWMCEMSYYWSHLCSFAWNPCLSLRTSIKRIKLRDYGIGYPLGASIRHIYGTILYWPLSSTIIACYRYFVLPFQKSKQSDLVYCDSTKKHPSIMKASKENIKKRKRNSKISVKTTPMTLCILTGVKLVTNSKALL